MRVAFLNPNLDGSPIPNLGLAYVMSAVEPGNDLILLDMSFHGRDYQAYTSQRLREFKPDVVAFSVTSFSYHNALKIASQIRKEYADIPLVYGGVHPTLMPEETIKNSLVDAICIGEGEDAFKEYLNSLSVGRDPSQVAGIWYKDRKGEIIRNPLRPWRQDLDALPFPNWDYWEIEKYLQTNLYFVGAIGYLFSRGCPYNCTFCSNPALRKAVPGTFYRLRNPQSMIEEIKQNIVKYQHKGFRNIAFGDATFGLDPDILRQFCDLYKKENLHRKYPWVCQTRADVITEEWVSNVQSAGCCMVTLGIESAHEYIRTKVYGKLMSNAHIESAVKLLRKNKIMYALNLIIGCPEETKESVKASLDFIKRADPINTYVSFYQPLPKTELGEKTKKLVVTDVEKLTKPWNTVRISVKHMRRIELEMIMLNVRWHKVLKFMLAGLRLRGVFFLAAVFKYVFSIGKIRTMPLSHPYMEVDLEQRTLYTYLLDNWQKNFLRNL
ncbi:MAG: radical SAM protein [Candidatus Omnitrophota bacterium]